tara:strand:+ start:73 stop:684 length:612 start_codon:yes stop_codon:yes gene_type:complete
MNLIEMYSNNPNPIKINSIINILKKDGVIIYPTDTVYALGCLSNSSPGIEKILDIKSSNSSISTLSFIFKNISSLSKFVKPFDNKIFKILNKYLPGPYAFIMEARKKLPKPFHKRKELGVRIVNHPVLSLVLEKLDEPIVTSSLYDKNKNFQYITDPKIIYEKWGHKVDLMIDSGFIGNTPSTVIDLRGQNPMLIRKGKGKIF